MVADGRSRARPVLQAGKVLETRVPLTNAHTFRAAGTAHASSQSET